MAKNNVKGSSKGTRTEHMRKSLLLTSRILAAVMSVVFGILLVGSQIAFANEGTVTSFWGQDFVNYVKDDDINSEDINSDYYTSKYGSVKEVREAGMALTETAMNEGAVLLKNNGALPLSTSTDKVTMFSASSVKPVYSGTRESWVKSSSAEVDLRAGLKNAGLTVNDDLYNWYANSGYGRQYVNNLSEIYVLTNINEAPWDELPDSKTKEGFNTAIFVLSRIGGEGFDNTVRDLGEQKNDKLRGNYLILNETEKEVMSNIGELRKQGVFDKFIVLLNTTNQVALDFVDEYGVDAMLYCGSIGSRGANAVGNILTGKVNPSGKLSDTFWKNHYLNPTLTNWGQMSYDPNASMLYRYVGFTYDNSGVYNDGYVVYQEGIYSGYRYTETRYEDVVTGRANVGDFAYYDAVAYPFGYGLSYTSFEYSDFKVTYNAETDNYDISVKVTNTGSVAGKNAVQLFLQKPYTDYDMDPAHPVEKAAVQLVDFGKTVTLAKGASDVVNMSVARRELASYDSYGYGTYILEQGEYYFTVAQDAHEATNNILAAKGFTVDSGMDAEGNAALVAKVDDIVKDDLLKYSVSETGKEITNQFDDADPKIYEKGTANADSFEYITRNNWAGTVKFAYDLSNYNYLNNYVKLTKSSKISSDMVSKVEPDDGQYPTYGAAKKWQLIDLRADENGNRIAYDDPRWEELLDSLTFKEMADLLSDGFSKTKGLDSIGKPPTYDYDSDLGVIYPYSAGVNGLATTTDDPDKGLYPAMYLDNGVVGATRNKELMLQYGEQWGEDCLWAGYQGLYGTGANIHRSPYLGRSYGYFSEDPLLSGESIAYMNVGMESKGAYMLLKHCVLNEQECNRCGGASWANEQTIREVYLKVYQVAIERGNVQGVMTALNRIGAVPAPHHNFLNEVLRGEFGMQGYCVTDSYMGYMNVASCILAGNDLPLSQDARIYNYEKGYSKVAWAMRNSVHNILYSVVNGNVMNGITSDVRIISFEAEWIHALNIALPVVTTITMLCIAFFLAMEVWRYFWKPVPKEAYRYDRIVLQGDAAEEYLNYIEGKNNADSNATQE